MPQAQWIYLILGFLAFAALHSFTAGHTFKKWLFFRVPSVQPFYRILYNFVAVITFWLWLLLLPSGGRLLYELNAPFNYLFYLIQITSLAGLYWATRLSDNSAFLGIEQIKDYYQYNRYPENLDEPAQDFIINGAYRYMRHPWYTFIILILLFRPDLTLRWSILALFCITYFWIGSYFEERKLRSLFGDAYKRYQQQVPRFIPRLSQVLNFRSR